MMRSHVKRLYVNLSGFAPLLIALLLASGSIVAQENHAHRNFKLSIGPKSMDKDYWYPVEKQLQYGAMFDYKADTAPFNFAFGLFYSNDNGESTYSGSNISMSTIDFLFGVNKYFVVDNTTQPYIGFGGVYTRIDLSYEGSDSESGAGIGFWFSGGLQMLISSNIALGAEVRYSQVEVDLQGDLEGGGLQFAVFVGYHF
jgi:opacity protein-like surface antigen